MEVIWVANTLADFKKKSSIKNIPVLIQFLVNWIVKIQINIPQAELKV